MRHDLAFWTAALGPGWDTWMGRRKCMIQTKGPGITAFSPARVQTDACKVHGVGAVLGTEVLSQRWDRDVTPEHSAP